MSYQTVFAKAQKYKAANHTLEQTESEHHSVETEISRIIRDTKLPTKLIEYLVQNAKPGIGQCSIQQLLLTITEYAKVNQWKQHAQNGDKDINDEKDNNDDKDILAGYASIGIPKEQICRNFLQNKCFNKDCKYMHIKPGTKTLNQGQLRSQVLNSNNNDINRKPRSQSSPNNKYKSTKKPYSTTNSWKGKYNNNNASQTQYFNNKKSSRKKSHSKDGKGKSKKNNKNNNKNQQNFNKYEGKSNKNKSNWSKSKTNGKTKNDSKSKYNNKNNYNNKNKNKSYANTNPTETKAETSAENDENKDNTTANDWQKEEANQTEEQNNNDWTETQTVDEGTMHTAYHRSYMNICCTYMNIQHIATSNIQEKNTEINNEDPYKR